jgi:hypothetical protein
MKIPESILLIFLSPILFSSCEKDKPEPGINRDNIVFGEYTNMNVVQFDTIISGGYYDGKEFEIDFDGDNINDVRISSWIWGSPGMGMHPHSSVISLHEGICFQGNLTNDTLFLNHETRYYERPNNIMEIHDYYKYTYERLSAEDSILRINYDIFEPGLFNRKDVMSKDDFFRADSISIKESLNYNSIPNITQKGDTTIYRYESSYSNNFVFPQGSIRFIGIRLNKENKSKLGWLKLSIEEYFRVTILETALQKD